MNRLSIFSWLFLFFCVITFSGCTEKDSNNDISNERTDQNDRINDEEGGEGENNNTGDETKDTINDVARDTLSDDNDGECLFLTLEDGALQGLFSVAEKRFVQFSQGNLQYSTLGNHLTNDGTIQAGTWRFADNQTDIVGTENSNASDSYQGYIDLFGWGTSGWTSGAVAVAPYSISGNYADYYVGGVPYSDLYGQTANADWGVYNAISNGGNLPNIWRTLSVVEWFHLFYQRNGSVVCGVSNARFCKAQVQGMKGIILFPDVFELPEDVYLRGINQNVQFLENYISSHWWEKIERAGAVFLPAAGSRYLSEVDDVGLAGVYWTSIHSEYCYGCYFDFDNSVSGINVNDYRGNAFSVRLVHDVQCGEKK